MAEFIEYLAKYGWVLALIAIAGVVILGVMKYCNLFSKLEEKTRHFVYIGISVGLSVLGSAIYLLCSGQFEISYFIGIALAIYALNQAWYNIFKVTELKELIIKVLEKIIELFKKTEDKSKEK